MCRSSVIARRWFGVVACLVALGPPAARAAAPDAAASGTAAPGLQLLEPRTYRLRVVTRVEAPESALQNVVAVAPIPIEWPEQKLRLLSEKLTPGAKVSEQILKGQAGLLRLQVPAIAKGESATVERLYEITRYRLRFVPPSGPLKPPRSLPGELRQQLTGAAPGIDTTDPRMIELAAQFAADQPAWDRVHAIWKWTRDNVAFQNGDFRGALFAIEQGRGDCEEMSALFVGLLRLNGLQGRTVWVEGHDYPEFYLVDQQGRGHWIPAQVVGPEWFGEMTEYRPIFQKGDRFYDPLQKKLVRYVPHTAKCDGKAAPRLVVDHQIIADSDVNGPQYADRK